MRTTPPFEKPPANAAKVGTEVGHDPLGPVLRDLRLVALFHKGSRSVSMTTLSISSLGRPVASMSILMKISR